MININVTSNDIRVGKRKCRGYCPVAYALKRVFGRNDVEVYGSYAFIGCHIVELPPHIESWIADFDKRLSVRTVSFQLSNTPFEFRSDPP